MTVDDRALALERLQQLRECLARGPDVAALAGFVESVDQLARSVESFHMEAIRFQLFGLRRRLATYEGPLPDAASGLLDETSAALEAAGFHIK